jgi:thiaminase (transcriptional activator TenA)
VTGFVGYEAATDGVTFSDWVRAEAGSLWDRMVQHRFTQDVALDTVAPEVWRRYLIYEYSFVETAVVIFGYALVRAPSIAERTRLAKVLSDLTNEQISYFEDVFVAMGIQPTERHAIVPPVEVGAFRDGMLATAANGTYEEIIGSMCAAEWMYLTWCSEASQRSQSDPGVSEWVAMHAAPPFVAQVAWLRAQLDEFGPSLGPQRQRSVAAAFSRALALEIGFHDAPYRGTSVGGQPYEGAAS